MQRWWDTRWFAVAAILLSALPLLLPPLPPLTDLPAQLGRYRVMLGTDADTLGAYYRFGWRPIGYLGVDLLVAGLAPLIGLEAAVKAIVCAIPMLMTAAMLWTSHAVHGRVQPMALLALPFAYHLAFQFGFLNYALAAALAFLALPLWLMLTRQRRFALRSAVFVGVSAAVWTAHVFGWLILGVLIFSAELARAFSDSKRPWAALPAAVFACLPLAAPAVMLIGWHPGSATTGNDWWASLALKPGWLIGPLRDRWRWFDVGAILIVALLLYRAIRSPAYRKAPALMIAALLLLGLFFAMPFGAAYGDARIAAFIWIAALLAVEMRPAAPAREAAVIATIALALFVARTAADAASFLIESNVWQRHLAAIDHLPRGSRVASFVEAACAPSWRLPRTIHLPSFAIARRAAFTNDQPDLGSAALMRVIAPGVGRFAYDPSQIVMAAPCPASPEFLTLREALRRFPRGAFDHVWLIDAVSLDPRDAAGLRLIWRQDNDFLFAVDPPRLSSAPAAD